MTRTHLIARRIRVSGIVQGVGFRPFVWRLAQELGLRGWVRNDAQGVDILAQGSAAALDDLQGLLHSEAPALALVDAVQAQDVTPTSLIGFTILPSVQGQTLTKTAIGPDVGLCPDCLADLFEPANRRWRHAFITCTHCGECARVCPEPQVLDLKRLESVGFVAAGECSNCGRCTPVCPEGSLRFDFKPLIRGHNLAADAIAVQRRTR